MSALAVPRLSGLSKGCALHCWWSCGVGWRGGLARCTKVIVRRMCHNGALCWRDQESRFQRGLVRQSQRAAAKGTSTYYFEGQLGAARLCPAVICARVGGAHGAADDAYLQTEYIQGGRRAPVPFISLVGHDDFACPSIPRHQSWLTPHTRRHFDRAFA
jgi:hypothetical protein